MGVTDVVLSGQASQDVISVLVDGEEALSSTDKSWSRTVPLIAIEQVAIIEVINTNDQKQRYEVKLNQ